MVKKKVVKELPYRKVKWKITPIFVNILVHWDLAKFTFKKIIFNVFLNKATVVKTH
jgi:hypothetical protein